MYLGTLSRFPMSLLLVRRRSCKGGGGIGGGRAKMYGGYTNTLNQLSMLFHAPPVALPNRPVEIPFPPVAIPKP
jgi:hypothetical protein